MLFGDINMLSRINSKNDKRNKPNFYVTTQFNNRAILLRQKKNLKINAVAGSNKVIMRVSFQILNTKSENNLI